MEPADLTIGFLTYDDFDGAWMTIESLRFYHREVINRINFLIVDNNPDSEHGQKLADVYRDDKQVSYSAIRGKTGSTLKNLVFELSPSPVTLCMDSHVMLAANSIRRLLNFYDQFPECDDLLHGPLVNEQGDLIGTEMNPNISNEMFGQWHIDDRGKDETNNAFEIAMHGMGMFACRTAAWLRFPSGMQGFGGEEGIIHEMFRLSGRKCWCMPFLRWLHRFPRVGGPRYPLTQHDKIQNHLVGFRAAQLPIAYLWEHFEKRLDPNPDEARKKRAVYDSWVEQLPVSTLPERDFAPFLGKAMQVMD